MYDTDKIIERMIQASGAKNTAQMLDICGFSSGAAGAWKRRKNIPDGSIAIVASRTGVNFEWIKTGEGEMHSGQFKVVEPLPHWRSTATAAQETPCAISPQIVRDVVLEVEAELDRRHTTLAPEKKAELIALICEEVAEEGAVNKEKVKTLIKLAM